MKQLIQSLDSGDLSVEEVPAPKPNPTFVLLKTTYSSISSGTENSLVQFGKANWLSRAKNHPEHVQKTIEKIAQVGVPATMKAIKGRLEQPIPLGYSSSGIIIDAGNSKTLNQNERVAAIAPHAELALIGSNFVCPLPANVSNKAGAFTGLGCVALHAVREIQPLLGESIAVIGLGLLGQLCLQILRANGCKVYGIEPRLSRRESAQKIGFEVVKQDGDLAESSVDAVIIAASSQDSQTLVAAQRLCKQRGRIVLLGTADIRISRAIFFEKELRFSVSRSMGIGRYDYDFATHKTYPDHIARWDLRGNMESFLDLMSRGLVDVEPLIEKILPIEKAPQIYASLNKEEAPLGILISYPNDSSVDEVSYPSFESQPSHRPSLSIIGAGNFVFSTLGPALDGLDIRREGVVSLRGLSAKVFSKKYNFRFASADTTALISSPCDAIILATQHQDHADYAVQILQSGKHLFVEKPMALHEEELVEVENAFLAAREKLQKNLIFCVGFNRRFAPALVHAKSLIDNVGPRSFLYTINAPKLPADHWLLDPLRGGGAFIGEACHFIDLLGFLSSSKVIQYQCIRSDESSGSLHLKYDNGDLGTIIYTTRGSDLETKEELKIFVNQSTIKIDNATKISISSNNQSLLNRLKRRTQTLRGKGHKELLGAFIHAIRTSSENPIPFSSLMETHRIAIQWQKA